MQNIEEILKQIGIEIPEDKKAEFTAAVAKNYKTVAEFDKKIGALETERDSFKTQYETAKTTLSGFDGVDVEGMKTQIADWKKKAEDAEKDYSAKIYERDFNDALTQALGGYEFTSNAAKKSVTDEVKAAGLKLVDGKIVGLSDIMDGIKAKDADAFKPENPQKEPAQFTKPFEDKGEAHVLDEMDKRIAKYKKS